MKKEQIIVRDLTSTGEGVGTLSDKVIFVDGALPKEEVEVSVTLSKKSYSKGSLLRIINPSKYRTVPPCKYFSLCGGCAVQHAETPLQLEVKRNRVISALKKIAGLDNPPVLDCVPSVDSYGYRNKITVPLLNVKGRKKIGFFKKRSHEIVSIESCLLHLPFADSIYSKVREILLTSEVTFYNESEKKGVLQHLVIRSSDFEGKVLIGIIGLTKPSKSLKEVAKQIYAIQGVKGVVYGRKSKATNSIYPEYEELLEGQKELTEKLLGVEVKISLLSFFQVNKRCSELLYKKAFELACLERGDRALDAYSGIGTFAIYLAQKGMNIKGIESFPKAVLDAKENARANGVDVEFIEGEVEKKILDFSSLDCVFINPPRKGVHSDVIFALGKISPKKIIYTSCDPGTLARDVKMFLEQGYELVTAAPFDMFPQTMHVETIVKLEKRCC